MKVIPYLLFVLCIAQAPIFAQSTDSTTATYTNNVAPTEGIDPGTNDNKIHTRISKMPELPDGFNELLSQKIKYPKAAKDAKISGKVIVECVVEKDGSLTDVKATEPYIGYGLEEEAVRAIKTMPKLKPAIYEGKVVRSKVRLPIVFTLK